MGQVELPESTLKHAVRKRPPPPPVETRWKPGQSGNPGGRPSTEREVTQAARELSLTAVKAMGDMLSDPKTMALAKVRAAEVILERAFGKAPQRVFLAAETAGLDNPALQQFFRSLLTDAVAETIEGEPPV